MKILESMVSAANEHQYIFREKRYIIGQRLCFCLPELTKMTTRLLNLGGEWSWWIIAAFGFNFMNWYGEINCIRKLKHAYVEVLLRLYYFGICRLYFFSLVNGSPPAVAPRLQRLMFIWYYYLMRLNI